MLLVSKSMEFLMSQPPQQPPQPPPGQPRIQLELPANLSAIYANAAMISQSHSEIIMDFIQIMPNDPRARVQARVVMTPTNAKLFLKALETNLERFEKTHGEISVPPPAPTLADQLFGRIKPEDDKETKDGAPHE
jgi:Protein of unknown function (DUF3467)